MSMLEWMKKFDEYFVVSKGRTIDWFSKSGRFAVGRDAWNDRGDMSSLVPRVANVESVGLVQDMGIGPFLIMISEDVDDEFSCPHCGDESHSVWRVGDKA